MENHPIDLLIKNTMENLKDMIDVNTIVGDAIESSDGAVILPISKVSVGFAAGGGQYSASAASTESEIPFGGGSGAGVSVRPVAFLVIKEDKIRLLPLDSDNTLDKIVDTVPQILDMFKPKTTSTPTPGTTPGAVPGQNTTPPQVKTTPPPAAPIPTHV